MSFLIQRQRFLELLSWQGGGEQRMAFPPWRPLSGVDKKVEAGDDQNIEMGCILQQLNVLKTLCSTSVSHTNNFNLSHYNNKYNCIIP